MVKCKVRVEETVNTCRVMGTGQRMWRNCAVRAAAVRVGLAGWWLLQWLAAATMRLALVGSLM